MRQITYARPTTTASTIATLRDAGLGTRILAGGTTLYDLMKLNVETPDRIVDINTVQELSRLDTSGDMLHFGALVRMADAAEDARLGAEFPILTESLWKAASQQLRNMASLGGNLLQRTRCSYFRHGEPFPCNKRAPGSDCAAQEGINRSHALFGGSEACIATYPGDWAVGLIALDAQVVLEGPDGSRTIELAALHRQPGTAPEVETVLAPDEIITAIRVPADPVGRASTYHKVRDRESYAFAVVSAGVALRVEEARLADVRVALGGVATVPWRATAAEDYLRGRALTPETAAEAGRIAFDEAQPRTHNAFKTTLGARTVADALMIAGGKA